MKASSCSGLILTPQQRERVTFSQLATSAIALIRKAHWRANDTTFSTFSRSRMTTCTNLIRTISPVSLLDVSRSNAPLRNEILEAIAAVYDSGRFLYGPQVTELENEIAKLSNTGHAIGCASGSDALILALMANCIGPGDEVIVPSFTFFASASCVSRVGAKIVFVDIDPRTYNLDPAAVEAAITSRTRAIIPVHLFGQAAQMDAICRAASKHDIPIIEDTAQAIGGACHSSPLGSWGQMGCTSFYPTRVSADSATAVC